MCIPRHHHILTLFELYYICSLDTTYKCYQLTQWLPLVAYNNTCKACSILDTTQFFKDSTDNFTFILLTTQAEMSYLERHSQKVGALNKRLYSFERN